jgi:hypothetical protein
MAAREIVKVQVPTDAALHVLVTDVERKNQRAYLRERVPDWVVRRCLQAGGKAYFNAIFHNGEWDIRSTAETQPW